MAAVGETVVRDELQERRWRNAFGPLVARHLDARRSYAVVRVAEVDFAFADPDAYVRALGQIWEAGFVPEPRPTATGARLPEVAPDLRGVDLDLADLRPEDVRPRPRRSSRH
jgi:hypothetical protein